MFSIQSQSSAIPASLLEQSRESLKKILNQTEWGFAQIPRRSSLWSDCEALAQQWRGNVDQIVLIGTGGSSLGVQVITEMLGILNVIYIDNVDPLHFQNQIESLQDVKRTGWIVTSKSGSTIETLCALEMVLQVTSLSSYVAVISEKRKNSLTEWAQKNSYPQLEIPEDVGGRYSILSPVGMFPAALLGLDLSLFRQGAEEALKSEELIAQLIAQTLMSFERNEWVTVFWIYASRGLSLGRWIQQLWAESPGKEQDVKGNPAPRTSTPFIAIGTTDQHSTLQQMMEGSRDKFYWFIRFSSLEKSEPFRSAHFPETEYLKGHSMGELFAAEAKATQLALEHKGRESLCLQTQASLQSHAGEKALGFFFMMMELVVAGVAQHLGINAFNQPGVELGKRLAREHFKTPS